MKNKWQVTYQHKIIKKYNSNNVKINLKGENK